MTITQKHVAMFNAGKHPSANENMVKQTGYSREVYFKLRAIKEAKYGCMNGRLTLKDTK